MGSCEDHNRKFEKPLEKKKRNSFVFNFVMHVRRFCVLLYREAEGEKSIENGKQAWVS